MNARNVAADRGWQWIVEGFRLFRRQPLIWIALVVVMLLIWFASAMVPLVGPLAVSLLSPVFFAGLMTACRTTDEGGEPGLAQLFGAFKTHATPLVTVGGIYLVGNIVAVGITFIVAGGAALPVLMGDGAGDMESMRAAAGGLVLGVTIGLALFLPVLMAVLFAPLLVVFNNLSPLEAMKLSFAACWQNALPFLLYGIASLVLWVLAAIPLMLGFIVLLPVLVCSIYASYKDIFPADQAESPASPLLS